jgi:hypothetical protein
MLDLSSIKKKFNLILKDEIKIIILKKNSKKKNYNRKNKDKI